MTGKDLFVIIYTCTWAVLSILFMIICFATKCLDLDFASFICNIAFLSVTSIMVLIKPIRVWVYKHIIAKLQFENLKFKIKIEFYKIKTIL